MGYALIPLVLSLALALVHVVLSDAGRASKLGVATVVVASLVIWRFFPRWLLAATLLQVGASVYVLLYMKATGFNR